MGCWECRSLYGGLARSPRFKSLYLINCECCVIVPEIKGGGSEVEGYFWLPSKLKASLGYIMRHSLKEILTKYTWGDLEERIHDTEQKENVGHILSLEITWQMYVWLC